MEQRIGLWIINSPEGKRSKTCYCSNVIEEVLERAYGLSASYLLDRRWETGTR
jgi:hypothetical protein